MPDPRRAVPRTDQLLADPRLREAAARLGPDLVKRSVLVAKPATSTMPPRPKQEPKYVIHKEPDPAPQEEKKGGLLGSLKSLIKKD